MKPSSSDTATAATVVGPLVGDVMVDVDDRQQDADVDVSVLAALLRAALADADVRNATRGAEVGLAFIEVAEMAQLNEHYMSGEGPTDVLAFPIDGVGDSVTVPDGQPIMLGDIVICPAVAARAPQPLEDELALLVVHGALHLVGHDHAEPDETAVMKALEAALLDRYAL